METPIVTKSLNFSINRLPEDVLVQIFLLGSGKQTRKSRYPHIRLSNVCRYWRDIINGHAIFWTVIQFSPWKGEEFIREIISRSRSANLSVLAPNDEDICPRPGVSITESNKILSEYDVLIRFEGHRIRSLYLTGDQRRSSSLTLLTYGLPAITNFIWDNDPYSQSDEMYNPLAILTSTKTLEYLRLNLSYRSSCKFSELDLCFHRLKGLHIRLSDRFALNDFYSCLPLCINLESLTLFTPSAREWIGVVFDLPSVITLPNLISLSVDCYTLIDKVHAPALRSLIMVKDLEPKITQRGYLIFDNYDISSITHLSIRGWTVCEIQDPPDIFWGSYEYETGSPTSTICIQGSVGPLPSYHETLNLSAMFEVESQDSDVDLRGDFLPSVPSSHPIHFRVLARTYHPDRLVVPEQSLHSKIYPKLRNLEVLYLDPYFPWKTLYNPDPPRVDWIEWFLDNIFYDFVSVGIRCLIIGDTYSHPDILRVVFECLHSFSSKLANLDTIIIRMSCLNPTLSANDLGEELLDFLRLREKAGCRPLQNFKVEGGYIFRENWVAEAATLGTAIIQ